MEFGGVIALLILIADVWAIVRTIQAEVSTGARILWIVIIAVLPVIGLTLWFFFGPKPTVEPPP